MTGIIYHSFHSKFSYEIKTLRSLIPCYETRLRWCPVFEKRDHNCWPASFHSSSKGTHLDRLVVINLLMTQLYFSAIPIIFGLRASTALARGLTLKDYPFYWHYSGFCSLPMNSCISRQLQSYFQRERQQCCLDSPAHHQVHPRGHQLEAAEGQGGLGLLSLHLPTSISYSSRLFCFPSPPPPPLPTGWPPVSLYDVVLVLVLVLALVFDVVAVARMFLVEQKLVRLTMLDLWIFSQRK